MQFFWMKAMNGKSRIPRATLGWWAVALVFGILGITGAAIRKDEASRGERPLVMPSSAGLVVFDHEGHTNRATGCEVCHHELAGALMATCVDCHGDEMEGFMLPHEDLVSIEAHTCDSCHEIAPVDAVQTCSTCHNRSSDSSPEPAACVDCHEPEIIVAGVEHALLVDLHGDCSLCHQAGRYADVMHQQCIGCHRQENPDVFLTAEGDNRCSACHLK